MTAKEELIQYIIDHPDRIDEIAALIKQELARQEKQ